MSNTFERSCEHWSEGSRQEMEDFYSLASVDYEYLAKTLDWKSWLEERQKDCGNKKLQLLDVACGSGKFPAAVIQNSKLVNNGVKKIDYSLLDPSSFSIEETSKVLKHPFELKNKYETTLQDFKPEIGVFDVIWAIHALYAIPKDELKLALSKLLCGLNGHAFIAHGCEDGHYVKFHKYFIEAFGTNDSYPYISAEDIIKTLQILNIKYKYEYLTYTNGTNDSNTQQVERYLQRCVFDDEVSFKKMLDHPLTGNYLNTCHQGKEWKFSQKVMLIFFQNNSCNE